MEEKIANHVRELLDRYSTDDERLALRLYGQDCERAERVLLLRDLLGKLPDSLLEEEGRYYLALERETHGTRASDLEILQVWWKTCHRYQNDWCEILTLARERGHHRPG